MPDSWTGIPEETQPQGKASWCLALFIQHARPDTTGVKSIFQLHDAGAGKGKGSPFTSYSVNSVMELCTPLQIANFSVAIQLALTMTSDTQGSKTGLSVAWQPTSLNSRRVQEK